MHTHDDSPAYKFCPVCGSPLEPRVLKITRAEAAGLHQHRVRIRVLPRPEDRGRDDHPRRERADCAGQARHRAGLREVGVPRRLRRSRRRDHAGRAPGGEGRSRPRRPPRSPHQHLLLRRPRAGDRRLRGDDDSRASWPWTTRASRRASSTWTTSRGTTSPSAARARRFATTSTDARSHRSRKKDHPRITRITRIEVRGHTRARAGRQRPASPGGGKDRTRVRNESALKDTTLISDPRPVFAAAEGRSRPALTSVKSVKSVDDFLLAAHRADRIDA